MKEGLIYFLDGEIVARHKSAKVYKMNDELFLEIGFGHTLWALESEFHDYVGQLQDLPNGDCLEIGLGLGVASRYILTFPKVKHLTTIEINSDVVEVNKKIKESDRKFSLEYNATRHTILTSDGLMYAYQTRKKYDFIFVDCYDRIDEDTLPLIADMAIACRRILKEGGKMIGWLDQHTAEPHYGRFINIFNGR